MSEITRYSPLAPLRSIRREMDRFFDDILPLRWFEENEELMESVWTPRADLRETDEEYIINMDLPGVVKKELTVNMQDNVLSISGERKQTETTKEQGYFRKERVYGNFYRAFTLPQAVKEDKIEASFKDGVLTIHVPKVEKTKPHKIEIH